MRWIAGLARSHAVAIHSLALLKRKTIACFDNCRCDAEASKLDLPF